MKADVAIYTHVLGVPGQYESVALMLSHKIDFNCCANRDSFRKFSHICTLTLCTFIISSRANQTPHAYSYHICTYVYKMLFSLNSLVIKGGCILFYIHCTGLNINIILWFLVDLIGILVYMRVFFSVDMTRSTTKLFQ